MSRGPGARPFPAASDPFTRGILHENEDNHVADPRDWMPSLTEPAQVVQDHSPARAHVPSHGSVSHALHRISQTFHDAMHRRGLTGEGRGGTIVVLHVPSHQSDSSGASSAAASGQSSPFAPSIQTHGSDASTASDTSTVEPHVVYVKLPPALHLTKEAIQAALHDVADKLHHMHLPEVHPTDWFRRKHRDLNAMATPAGTDTAPAGSIINLLNGTLGAGILAMPLMFSLMGWVLATMVLALTCFCGIVTTTLMTYVGSYEHTESYHMTIHHTLGKRFVTVYEVLLIAGGLGGLMTYLILIGDFATAALSQLLVTTAVHTINRRVIIVIIALFAVLPLALLRKVKSLWFTGFMAMMFVAFYVLAMLHETSTHVPSPQVAGVDTSLPNFFRALPLSFYAFACHNSVFPVYHEMQRKSPRVFRKVSTANHLITLVLYFASGMSGYWLFGLHQGGNVLKQFANSGSELMSLVTVCFLFTIVFVFPMGNFSMRICIHHLLFGETDTTHLQHVLETVLPFVVILTGSLFVTNLGIVYSLIGSIGSCSFALLFPTAMYLRSKNTPRHHALTLFCRVAFSFGCCMLVLGVVTSFAKA